jgi:hypothetical protein
MDEDREAVLCWGEVRSWADGDVGCSSVLLLCGSGCDAWGSAPDERVGDAGLLLPRGVA